MEFTFSVRSSGLDFSDNAQIDRLFNPDINIIVSERDLETWLTIDLEAVSEADAFRQFITHMDHMAPGVLVERLDLDLVTATEVANRLDMSRETVRLWTLGKRRKGFPASFGQAGGSRVWVWSDVYAWLVEQSIEISDVYDIVPFGLRFIEAKNVELAKAREARRQGWFVQTQAQKSKPVVVLATGFTPSEAKHQSPVYYGALRAVTADVA